MTDKSERLNELMGPYVKTGAKLSPDQDAVHEYATRALELWYTATCNGFEEAEMSAGFAVQMLIDSAAVICVANHMSRENYLEACATLYDVRRKLREETES